MATLIIFFSCSSVWWKGAGDHVPVACCGRLKQSSDFGFQDQLRIRSGVSDSKQGLLSHIPAPHLVPSLGSLAVWVYLPSTGSRRKAGATNLRRASRQGGMPLWSQPLQSYCPSFIAMGLRRVVRMNPRLSKDHLGKPTNRLATWQYVRSLCILGKIMFKSGLRSTAALCRLNS